MIRRQFLWLLNTLLMVSIGMKADDVQIGSGTTSNANLPTYMLYNNCLSEQIYTSGEIGTAGNITSISFYSLKAATRTLDVYLVPTDLERFDDTDSWVRVTTDDKYFSGTVAFVNGGWVTLTLTQPYFYDGESNMILVVADRSGSYVSGGSFYSFAATGQALYKANDGSPVSPVVQQSGGYLVNQKNQLKLHIDVAEAPTCAKPVGLVLDDATGTSATISWPTEDGTRYNLRYRRAGAGSYTMKSGISSPCTLQNLTLASQYEVQVQAACGPSEVSDWSNTFTFVSDCCMPEEKCDISYLLTDAYGDGWTDNAIRVIDVATGNDVASITLPKGVSVEGSLSLCHGRTYRFVWNNPTAYFSDECAYEFYDVAGDEIFSGTGVLAAVDYQMDCSIANNCKTPRYLTATEVLATKATLKWNAIDDDQDRWEIAYSTSASFNPEGVAPVTATANPYTLTGLTPETTYYVYVRAVCSTSDYSHWSKVASFTTIAANAVVTDVQVNTLANSATISWTGESDRYVVQYRLPSEVTAFYDDFEEDKDQWTVYTMGTAPSEMGWDILDPAMNGLPEAHSGNKVVSSWSWNQQAYNADNWLVTPQMELKNTLKFWVLGSSKYPDHFEVLLSTTGDDVEDFTVTLKELTAATSTWTEVVIDMSAYAGQQGYIAIRHLDNDQNYLFLDDFGVYETREAGPWNKLTTTDNHIELTGLTANTTYEFQIVGYNGQTPNKGTDIDTFTTLKDDVKAFVADGNWNDAGNWLPQEVPTADDDVVIYANAIVPADVVAEANKVSISGGSVTLRDGGQLIQATDGITVTMEKDIKGYGDSKTGNFCMLAAPFIDDTRAGQVENLLTGQYDFYKFQYTMQSEWRNHDITDIKMRAGEGYLYANKTDRTLKMTNAVYASKGKYITADVDYYAQSTHDFIGWQLIGNPFTCNAYVAYDVEETTFLKMNADGNGYEAYPDLVMLKPGEACLMYYSGEGTLYFFAFNPFEVEPQRMEVSGFLPALPKHGMGMVNQDASPMLTLYDTAADNSQAIANYNDLVTNVVLNGRTLYKDGSWNTLCLPFDLTLEGSVLEGATVKTLESATMTGTQVELNFGEAVEAMEAGVPYIIKWEETGENIKNPSFSKVTITGGEGQTLNFDEYVKFTGYYDAFAITPDEDDDIFYLTADNKLARTAKERTLNACRAYFRFTKNSGNAINTFNLNFGDGEATATGISELSTGRSAEGCYNMQGMRISGKPNQKGIYISNGRKVVVK